MRALAASAHILRNLLLAGFGMAAQTQSWALFSVSNKIGITNIQINGLNIALYNDNITTVHQKNVEITAFHL